jgi:predicted Rossmann-fold nucleotide-binding protein
VGTSSWPAKGGPPAAEIAVLGSARIGPGDPRHHQAQLLGGQLAAQGWTVVTDGYGGLMAAVAGGAQAAGGRTVGAMSQLTANLRPGSPVSVRCPQRLVVTLTEPAISERVMPQHDPS